MLIIDMPKKYLTDASGFVSCAMCQKYLPLLYRDCHNDFKSCLIKGELPEEHGDLIDRDALLERHNKSASIAECLFDSTTAKSFEKYCIIADALEAAPTVIAAERKDDGNS